MKAFKKSADLAELREAVKALDEEIIRLLGERLRYSLDAVRFKESEAQIKNPVDMGAFYAQRRTWAEEYGADPAAIGDIYKVITEDSMAKQLQLFSSRRSADT